MMIGRTSQSRSQKSHLKPQRLLGAELLESREMLSINPWVVPLPPSLAGAQPQLQAFAPLNQAPTVSRAVSTIINTAAGGKTASLSVLGADDGGEARLSYTWSFTTLPAGSKSPTLSLNGSNAAKNTTVTFAAAGNYGLSVKITDAAGLSTTTSTTFAVQPVLTSIAVAPPNGTPVSATAPLIVTSTAQGLSTQCYDQFGKATTPSAGYTWTATALPSGGSETFSANGSGSAKSTTVSFNKAGAYGLSVKAVDASGATATTSISINVQARLGSMTVSPGLNGLAINGTSQQFTVQGLDQFRNTMAGLTTTWSTLSLPSGAVAPTFANSGSVTVVKFSQAGAYGLSVKLTDSYNTSTTSSGTVTVNRAAASLSVVPATTGAVTGTTQTFTVNGVIDQFGKPLTSQPSLVWSTVALPSGAPTPAFSSSGKTTVVTFGQTGTYSLKLATSTGSLSTTLGVTVSPTLTRVVVTPGTATVVAGGTQAFSAQGFDQFQKALATQPAYTWSASAGTITSAGLLTAPSSAGTLTVTAKNGSAAGTASVTVTAGANGGGKSVVLNLPDKSLSSLVTSLDGDGSISRNDVLQILRTVDNYGSVTASELADLNTILANATALNMPGYVQVLATDVVKGNPANAHYQGQTLGNLTVGSSATQLSNLINKWFLGTDLPTTGGYAYQSAAGTLLVAGPSYTDARQGLLGDCYFISSLGSIALSNPAAVQNMFLDNGDGTYTVRFYNGTPSYSYQGSGVWSDGFSGSADYVTVNGMLPVNGSGQLVFDGYGASAANTGNELWIPLAEKAYAQWNETGRTWRGGSDANQNSYTNIQGGWMSDVYSQVLGIGCTEYDQLSTSKQAMINALAANRAVSIGTLNSSSLPGGLYGSHAYAVVGYNSTADTFTLYNPWGFAQPTPLTWAQITSACSAFMVADPSGSQAISSKPGLSAAALHSGLHDSPAAPDAVLAKLNNSALSAWGSAAAGNVAADELASARALQPAAAGASHGLFSSGWSWSPSALAHHRSSPEFDLNTAQIDQVFHDGGLLAADYVG